MRFVRRLLVAGVCLVAHSGAATAEVAVHLSAGFDELRLAAQRGDGAAAWRLGLMYRNGIGVGQDKARAAYWLTVAAQRGVAAAMFTLSHMLGEGEGVAVDPVGARRWLEAAAELEYPEALQQLALTESDPARAALLMKQAAHAMAHRAR